MWISIAALVAGVFVPVSAAAAPAPVVVSVPAAAVAYNSQPATVRITAQPNGQVVVDRLQIVVNGAVQAASSAALRPGTYRIAGRVTYRSYTVTQGTRHYGRSQAWTSAVRPLTVRHAVKYCGAPANPYGYNLCGGSLIPSPASGVCRYFACIPNFWNGRGYLVECRDGRYSLSGGRRGACSDHRGVWRPVYR